MHPAIFIGGFVLVGLLFAMQEWVHSRTWGYHMGLSVVVAAWGVQYLIWGVLCWLLWFGWGPSLQRAGLLQMITRLLPVSILVSVGEEMIWVACFPNLPMTKKHMTYWHRLGYELGGDFVGNMVVFWSAFLLFRTIGYYQQYREKEKAASQLAVELAQARLHALRMQLNPHFLFNTMNSISSLMRIDPDSADAMLEQLSSILRISLERGDAQLIRVSEEMEFTEMYLALQDRRFAGRVKQKVSVDPRVHDALIPAMILQPIIENAYTHGLSRLERDGLLAIDLRCDANRIYVTVCNNGIGLNPECRHGEKSLGVGLKNVKNRLRLHYGEEQSLKLSEVSANEVRVAVSFPLEFASVPLQTLTGYGV
jgi:two-component sensor histidine kinase